LHRSVSRLHLAPAAVALAASLASAAAAWAQQPDAPVLLPKSDVAVIYRFDKVGLYDYRKWQVTYGDGNKRVRFDYFRWVEAKYPYLTVIYDRPANHFITIRPEDKTYSERPIGNVNNPGGFLRADMTFTRLGTAVVAFATCTDWRVQEPGINDEQDTACVTEDGIVLRILSSKPDVSTMTAIAIRYGTPPEGVFEPPAGFRREPAG
jgi:hypothetical protein